VIAEDREGGLREPPEEVAQALLAGGAREQVAAETDEVRLSPRGPLDGALDRDGAARRQPEVEVGQVNDAEAVELARKPLELELERSEANPAGLEPAPGERGAGRTREAYR
jgi:hypothetical protein